MCLKYFLKDNGSLRKAAWIDSIPILGSNKYMYTLEGHFELKITSCLVWWNILYGLRIKILSVAVCDKWQFRVSVTKNPVLRLLIGRLFSIQCSQLFIRTTKPALFWAILFLMYIETILAYDFFINFMLNFKSC